MFAYKKAVEKNSSGGVFTGIIVSQNHDFRTSAQTENMHKFELGHQVFLDHRIYGNT
jgi:hypothetical protein